MGLRSWAKRKAAERVLEEMPMLKQAFSWLTDPAFAGRKRTITACLALVSGALRGSAAALAAACAAQALPDWACHVDPLTAASWADTAVQWLDAVVVPGTDALTAFMATWALYDAKRKGGAALAVPTPR